MYIPITKVSSYITITLGRGGMWSANTVPAQIILIYRDPVVHCAGATK